MTPRQRVLAAIAHREVRPVPFSIAFHDGIAHRLDEHYGSPEWREHIDRCFAGCQPVEMRAKTPTASEASRAVDVFGGLWRVDGLADHLVQPALPEPSFAGYRFPDPRAFRSEERLARCRESIRDNGDRFTVAGVWGMGLYESSWWMRGFEGAMTDAAADEGFYDELIERLARLVEACLDIALEVPADAVSFGDDFGDQNGVTIGPGRWRRFFKARYARIFGKAHAAGRFVLLHSCGSVADILPDLIDVGVDVLDPFQPEPRGMNPYELKRRYGGRITFRGGVGSQTTIPFGTPEAIRAEVRRLCREVGRGGGFIGAPAKAVRDETPLANAVALLEAFNDQGG